MISYVFYLSVRIVISLMIFFIRCLLPFRYPINFVPNNCLIWFNNAATFRHLDLRIGHTYIHPHYVFCADIILYHDWVSYVASIVLIILHVINYLYYTTLCVLNICAL